MKKLSIFLFTVVSVSLISWAALVLAAFYKSVKSREEKKIVYAKQDSY